MYAAAHSLRLLRNYSENCRLSAQLLHEAMPFLRVSEGEEAVDIYYQIYDDEHWHRQNGKNGEAPGSGLSSHRCGAGTRPESSTVNVLQDSC